MSTTTTKVTDAFELVVAPDGETASRNAATMVADQISAKPESLICAASGNTPKRMYELLTEMASHGRFPTDRLSVVKLDEWLGIPLEDPHTCDAFLHRHLLAPLSIPEDRYVRFESQPADAQSECKRVADEISLRGGIDVVILGVGVNGHIGLNEPADLLQPKCHVAELAPATRGHSMLEGLPDQVQRGITLGVGDILAARKILLLAFGDHKADPMRQVLGGQVSTRFPVSFVNLHADVTCICDRAAASLSEYAS